MCATAPVATAFVFDDPAATAEAFGTIVRAVLVAPPADVDGCGVKAVASPNFESTAAFVSVPELFVTAIAAACSVSSDELW